MTYPHRPPDIGTRACSALKLTTIKIAHTIVWAFFVTCILAIWMFAWNGDVLHAALAIGIVLVEVAVLVLNRFQCPLTPIAARYTDNRRANFDIYLPEWLAGRTKEIFGSLFAGGVLFTVARWTVATP